MVKTEGTLLSSKREYLLRARGPTAYPFEYHFDGKNTPFVNFSLKKSPVSSTFITGPYIEYIAKRKSSCYFYEVPNK